MVAKTGRAKLPVCLPLAENLMATRDGARQESHCKYPYLQRFQRFRKIQLV
jgi:hypothetical protein